MKIVLDTNCLLRAVPHKSSYHCIMEAFHSGRFTLCCSNEILMEYEELLAKFYNRNIAESVMNFIVNSLYIEKITPFFKWNLITIDYDDNKFVDCALNSGVDYIVTNDKHFNVLKDIDFPPLNIIDMETFKHLLG